MRPKGGWSAELDGLLESFEALRGLVVSERLGPAQAVAERLAALVPVQVGLSRGVVGSVDWELFRGGLLYAANALEKAHSLFQEASSPEGAYWHGMVHRREGDFSNALYWVRRAGPIPALAGLVAFSPTAFIAECAAAATRRTAPPQLLEVQRSEWEALMLWRWRRLETLG